MRYGLCLTFAWVIAALAVASSDATGARKPAVPAPGDQHYPAIIFNGASYFVAWTDTRAKFIPTSRSQLPPPPPPPPPPPRADVFGTRVNRAGEVLDAAGMAISGEARPRVGPALASDGSTGFVAWTNRIASDGFVHGARITRAGRVLDRPGIPISSGIADPFAASAAFDGMNYMVVWAEFRIGVGTRVYAARVTPGGKVLDTSSMPIWGAYSSYPAISFDGTNFLVAWEGASGQIEGTRVSPSGIVLDMDGIVISHSPGYRPAIAFDGTNYLVAWWDTRSGESRVSAARVSTTGNVLDSAGIRVSNGVTATGKPAITYGGANYLVAWADARFGCCSIYGARVSVAGSVLDSDGIAIATRGREQVEPAVAFDGTNYVVVWADSRSSNSHVYGARVTPAGRVLDPRGILLSTALRRTRERCLVPRVIGLPLAAAQRRIRRAHCSVGRVRRIKSARPGRVVSQRPRAGARRAHGHAVSLVVGRR
jgi:hypothetical protein